jgi:hypothetical protein
MDRRRMEFGGCYPKPAEAGSAAARLAFPAPVSSIAGSTGYTRKGCRSHLGPLQNGWFARPAQPADRVPRATMLIGREACRFLDSGRRDTCRLERDARCLQRLLQQIGDRKLRSHCPEVAKVQALALDLDDALAFCLILSIYFCRSWCRYGLSSLVNESEANVQVPPCCT